MSVNFEYYKIFYFVAKYKSITRAARALFLSQPTVSHYIRCLETELDCSLFLRSKKGVTLTPEAELLFSHVEKACSQLWEAEEALAASKSLAAGTVRIGASEMTLHNFLLPYLKKFRNIYPSLKLKISCGTTPGTLASLRDGASDFAIVISPLENAEGLEMTPLTSFQDIVIAGRSFQELKGRVLSIHELVRYPLICISQGSATRRFLEQHFISCGAVLEPDVEPATTDLVTPLVIHDLGIGIVPEGFASEALSDGSVFQIPIKEELPPRHICVVSDSSHPVSLAGMQFLELLAEPL
ncbi:LysR family transcriptional regulator [Lacrimispora sp. NSJ-141]|uniref:LysR family transcriptional regulator n=1 Tax=Lientehia hominis TaxID=2897778 RepID=A0AAP2RJM8_9FIRM|nr:LysR family transcriptional regulator [Lientehia hominis]MCD2492068.1 LysR family transcriptional regulator [Lientehia hominis]